MTGGGFRGKAGCDGPAFVNAIFTSSGLSGSCIRGIVGGTGGIEGDVAGVGAVKFFLTALERRSDKRSRLCSGLDSRRGSGSEFDFSSTAGRPTGGIRFFTSVTGKGGDEMGGKVVIFSGIE